MLQHHTQGASAPGPVTPAESDDAPAGVHGRGANWDARENSGDCADKAVATATARAALLGIEVHRLADGAWLLRHARGACIGTVCGREALAAAVAGFEAAHADVRELVQRMRGAA